MDVTHISTQTHEVTHVSTQTQKVTHICLIHIRTRPQVTRRCHTRMSHTRQHPDTGGHTCQHLDTRGHTQTFHAQTLKETLRRPWTLPGAGEATAALNNGGGSSRLMGRGQRPTVTSQDSHQPLLNGSRVCPGSSPGGCGRQLSQQRAESHWGSPTRDSEPETGRLRKRQSRVRTASARHRRRVSLCV